MPKIMHISDTHIQLTKRHDEYQQIFEQIYETARKEYIDFIVHTGDLFHSKIQLTPECVNVAASFLRNLADIAPLIIIPGNHDCSLRNNKRLDSISPIINALEHKNIWYFDKSGTFDKHWVAFGGFSMLDPTNYPKPYPDDYINIALYHGSIPGVLTDTGYVVEHGDCDVSIFEGYDYVLLGDIHLANQKVDDEGRMRYAGSTIQQNFGETDDKGILIWDIQDKKKFSVKHVAYKNPKPFVTLHLDENGNLKDKFTGPEKASIRIVSDHNLSVDLIKNAIDTVKKKHKPDSVTFVNKALTNKENLQQVSNLSKTLNLRDLGVQEQLIEEFLKQYNPDKQTLEKIFELNKKFNTQIEQNEEVGRNINWKLKYLEWDNLFNYGENNRIEFSKLNGVVGILGKNYSGKSSAGVDTLLYTLFNTTSKNARKNLNIINQNEERGRGKAIIEVNGNEYVIERTSEKYTKKSKGVETIEAKTDVTFSGGDEENMNGIDRNDTDKSIRRLLGSVDDFMLTSVATQFSAQSFIGEGSTNRKTILAKFLDLDIFESKFKAAKSESAEIKAFLKKLEGTDYDQEIKKTQEEIKSYEEKIVVSKQESEEAQNVVNETRKKLFEVQAELKQIKGDEESVHSSILEKIVKEKNKKSLEDKIVELAEEVQNLTSKLASLDSDIIQNIDEFLEKKAILEAFSKTLDTLESEYKLEKINNGMFSRQIEVLKEVPCGSEYSHCKFIKDAHAAVDPKDISDTKLVQIGKNIEKTKKEFNAEELQNISYKIKKHNSALTLKHKLDMEIKYKEIELERTKNKLSLVESEINVLEQAISKHGNPTDLVQTIHALQNSEYDLKRNLNKAEMNASSLQQKITSLYKDSGYQISRLENLEENKQELIEKRKEFGAYDLYLKAMHPNGISYQVIKNKLPIINEEINKTLANVTDFEVFLVNDDDKLDVMIKHPNYDARPLEMGSGAEKSLASIAIRLAFLSVTSLPKCDIFIMDEPGTSLDSDNLFGFIRILDLIRSSFKTVILISHLDILKDAVDSQIIIDKKGNYAYVNA